ncbi:MAG: hypothetical protein EXR51_11645 [Dehalococcoidia bacterium]|nr:hypothetical protein [Dehalococcoidia bacterium]
MISTSPTTSGPLSSALSPGTLPGDGWPAHGVTGMADEALLMVLVFGGFGAYLWWVRRAYKRRRGQSDDAAEKPAANGGEAGSQGSYTTGSRSGHSERPDKEER